MVNPKVAQITGKLQKTVTVDDPKIGKLEVDIRPLPAETLLANLDVFNKLNGKQEFNTDNLSDEQIDAVQNEILPVIKVVLPACVIDPPIALEDSDPRLAAQEAINLKDLTFKIVIDIFNEIMAISGLDTETEEARKKLASQTSDKQ